MNDTLLLTQLIKNGELSESENYLELNLNRLFDDGDESSTNYSVYTLCEFLRTGEHIRARDNEFANEYDIWGELPEIPEDVKHIKFVGQYTDDLTGDEKTYSFTLNKVYDENTYTYSIYNDYKVEDLGIKVILKLSEDLESEPHQILLKLSGNASIDLNNYLSQNQAEQLSSFIESSEKPQDDWLYFGYEADLGGFYVMPYKDCDSIIFKFTYKSMDPETGDEFIDHKVEYKFKKVYKEDHDYDDSKEKFLYSDCLFEYDRLIPNEDYVINKIVLQDSYFASGFQFVCSAGGGGGGGGGSVESLAPAWVQGASYIEGDLVTYEGKLYECIQSTSSWSWSTDDWKETTISESVLGLLNTEL